MNKPILTINLARKKLWLAAATFLLFVIALLWNGHPHQVPVVSVMAGQDESSLRQRVELLAKQYDAEPVDAKNDRVWKAIPGLNGVKVDVEATIQQAQTTGAGSRLQLVTKQIPPKVSLDELGALPIYRGNAEKKQMALMINVAWGTEYIPEILESLDQHQVKATFFLDGSWTAKNGEMAKRIAERGHELGNHAYTHPDMAQLDESRTLREISRTSEVIKRATGTRPKLFAPPSGSFNDTTVRVAHGQKMRTILWTLDTVDWKKPPAASIQERVLSRAENGAMVLMHPTEPTRDALRTILPGLLKKGYGLVTVSELLSEERPMP